MITRAQWSRAPCWRPMMPRSMARRVSVGTDTLAAVQARPAMTPRRVRTQWGRTASQSTTQPDRGFERDADWGSPGMSESLLDPWVKPLSHLPPGRPAGPPAMGTAGAPETGRPPARLGLLVGELLAPGPQDVGAGADAQQPITGDHREVLDLLLQQAPEGLDHEVVGSDGDDLAGGHLTQDLVVAPAGPQEVAPGHDADATSVVVEDGVGAVAVGAEAGGHRGHGVADVDGLDLRRHDGGHPGRAQHVGVVVGRHPQPAPGELLGHDAVFHGVAGHH